MVTELVPIRRRRVWAKKMCQLHTKVSRIMTNHIYWNGTGDKTDTEGMGIESFQWAWPYEKSKKETLYNTVSSPVDEYLSNISFEKLKTYQWTEPQALWEVSYWKWNRSSCLRRTNSAASINSSHYSSVTGFCNRSSVTRHTVMSLAFNI